MLYNTCMKYQITDKQIEDIMNHLFDLNIPVKSHTAIRKELSSSPIVERKPEDVPNPVN